MKNSPLGDVAYSRQEIIFKMPMQMTISRIFSNNACSAKTFNSMKYGASLNFNSTCLLVAITTAC